MRILFVGNSYTYYHDMPENIFAPMAREAGLDVQVQAVTHGGYKLSWFADPENEEGIHLRQTIAGQKYDVVVLQDHSLRTIQEPEGFLDGIEKLKELLKDHTEAFVLYGTWGRKPGCETLEELGMTNGEMTEHIAAAYEKAGQCFGMPVAQVGKAFAAYSQKHPDAELYFEDLHHSSILGSSIAAKTILDVIMNLK